MSDAEQYLTNLFAVLGSGGEHIQNRIREYITEQCAAERERCAKIAETVCDCGACECLPKIAEKIRSGE